MSPAPNIEAARAVDVRATSNGGVRKITGPRAMGSSRSPQPQQQRVEGGGGGGIGSGKQRRENNGLGTVRRKPVKGRESWESETF